MITLTKLTLEDKNKKHPQKMRMSLIKNDF